jgi:hypothetical protein
MPRCLVRVTTPADGDALRTFVCSTGEWYEDEAQTFIRGPLAQRVDGGFAAWVVEDGDGGDGRDGRDSGGGLAAVAAHEGRPHPDGSGALITYLMVIAARTDRVSWAQGLELSQLVAALVADVRATDRAPYWYSLVAADNVKMRRFHEQCGFIGGPVPSDPRYLFYAARLDS